jgi:O-antigen/teichoic acid export membrane protein
MSVENVHRAPRPGHTQRMSAHGDAERGRSPASPGVHPDEPLQRTLFSAACISFQPLLLNALTVPVMAYILHRLGPEAYGQWMAATAVLTACAVLGGLGLRGSFVRGVAANPASASTALSEQLSLRLCLAIPAGTFGVAVCALLGYPTPVLWCAGVGAVGLVLTVISSTLADVLQALHRIKTIAAVNMASGFALTAASLAAAILGAGPIAMAAAYLTGPIVAALTLLVIVRKRLGPVGLAGSLPRFRALLTRSRFLAAQQILNVGSAQAEALMLPRLIGLGQFGVFTAGALPANRLMILPDGLCTTVFPAMARACATSAASGAAVVGKYLFVASAAGTLVAIAGMFAVGPIGRLLFPNDVAVFSTVMRITIWALPLVSLDAVLGYALNAAGKDAAQAKATVPAAVTGLLGAVVLISTLGLTGACWSMLLRPAVRVAFLAPIAVRTFRAGQRSHPTITVLPSIRSTPLLRKAG